MNFRQANINDLQSLKNLGFVTWSKFKDELTSENWEKLEKIISDDNVYRELLEKSFCLVCENNGGIVGMSFLVPSGNPTEIYDKDWCYLRFVTVHPDFSGKGIGRKLTEKSIEFAKQNGEKIIALHTSEMMENARHIYESFGFQILRELPENLGKRYWLYTKKLN